MSKIKTSLKEPTIDNRLLDDRGPTPERAARLQQSPVERAVSRGTISEQHGLAAERFYDHWARSGYKNIISNWKCEFSAHGLSTNIPWSISSGPEWHRSKLLEGLDAIHSDMDRCGMSNDAIKLLFLTVCEEVPFEQAGQSIWQINGIAAGTLALRYVRSALRVLSIVWGVVNKT